jgi:predicted hydrocarbon binding protein
MIPFKYDPELHRRLAGEVLVGGGKAFRTEVGDFVNLFWRNLVSWSGMLWDSKRFPTMAYELTKEMEFTGLKRMLRHLPLHVKLLFKLMPKNFSEVKNVKRFLSIQNKRQENRGMRVIEYMDAASKRDEHHVKIQEGYNCWGLENVGARLAFQDCGLLAGAFKGFEKEDRDWNVVETKCVGLGDPYCELKLVPGEIPELKGFLESLDSSIVENVHDRIMDQLVAFLIHNRPLGDRPRLGNGLAFYLIYHVTYPSQFSERYRIALRLGGAKAGKEVGEHLINEGIAEDQAVKRFIDFLNYCKVGKTTLDDTIRMKENCESFLLDTDEPSCYFTTGFLNGFFSTVKNQHVKEVKCIGADDPYCEWEFR